MKLLREHKGALQRNDKSHVIGEGQGNRRSNTMSITKSNTINKPHFHSCIREEYLQAITDLQSSHFSLSRAPQKLSQ